MLNSSYDIEDDGEDEMNLTYSIHRPIIRSPQLVCGGDHCADEDTEETCSCNGGRRPSTSSSGNEMRLITTGIRRMQAGGAHRRMSPTQHYISGLISGDEDYSHDHEDHDYVDDDPVPDDDHSHYGIPNSYSYSHSHSHSSDIDSVQTSRLRMMGMNDSDDELDGSYSPHDTHILKLEIKTNGPRSHSMFPGARSRSRSVDELAGGRHSHSSEEGRRHSHDSEKQQMQTSPMHHSRSHSMSPGPRSRSRSPDEAGSRRHSHSSDEPGSSRHSLSSDESGSRRHSHSSDKAGSDRHSHISDEAGSRRHSRSSEKQELLTSPTITINGKRHRDKPIQKHMSSKASSPKWSVCSKTSSSSSSSSGSSSSSSRVIGSGSGSSSSSSRERELTSSGSSRTLTLDEDKALLKSGWMPVPAKWEWTEQEKLEWLRTQLIGESDLCIDTPFGKRPLVYVDHTASGKSLRFVEEFILRNVLPSYGNTHTEDSYVGKMTTTIMHQAEAYVKQNMLGNAKGDDYALMFCGNGCTAAVKRLQEVMGLAVPSTLRTRILESGLIPEEDRWLVFVGPYEHHSNLLSWRQTLAEVVEIPVDSCGTIDMTVMENALEANRGRKYKLGAFSACSNVTGLLTDTRAIARLFHKHGGYVCFDFAARAPHERIDMVSGNDYEGYYDAVVLSPHKFPGGPGSPGLLLMKKSLYLLQERPPSTAGGGTVDYVNGISEKDTLYRKNIEEREDAGTPAIVGKIRCALAFWVKDFMEENMIHRRESNFMDNAMKRLSENPNIEILGPICPVKRAPILSFVIRNNLDSNTPLGSRLKLFNEESRKYTNNGCDDIKPLHGRFVVKLLNDVFGIQARGGCACAGPYGHALLGVNKEQSKLIRDHIKQGYEALKIGWTRVSFCYNMTDEEVDYVLSSIEFIASHGHRFLPLYDFDWHSGNWSMLKSFTIDSSNNSEIQGVLSSLEQALQQDGDCSDCTVSHVRSRKFRQALHLAKSLSHHLGKIKPLSRRIPSNIDPGTLLFLV